MLSRFRMIVGRHCRSMGLVIHAHPLVPGGEMERQQAFHLQEMRRHTTLQELHQMAGDQLTTHRGNSQTRAERATDPRERARQLEAASLKGQLAWLHYGKAQIHKAEATQHREALGRLSNL